MRILKYRKVKAFIGIILIVLASGWGVFWNTSGKDLFFNRKVVVFKTDVQKGSLIKRNMLKLIDVKADILITDPVTDVQKILGKVAKHYIPKNAQLSLKYFEEYDFVLRENEFIFKIPNSWIKSLPDSIRRNDEVFLYEFDEFEDRETELVAVCRVAYVKDSANREVISVNKENRFNASAKIRSIEIIIELKQLRAIEKVIKKGNKLVLLYKEGAVFK